MSYDVQIWLFLALSAITTACSSAAQSASERATSTPAVTETAAGVPVSTPMPTDAWTALLEKQPHPYTTPLPESSPTVLDGTYAKIEPKEGTPVPCRRCPDYLPEGGVWRLHLDRGVYHIYHHVTTWQSLGSFVVSGERLYLFNDPTCFRETGTYEWRKADDRLKLEVIEDGCHVDRRARSFTNMEWQSCQPPSTEAAITDHWTKPAGCEED